MISYCCSAACFLLIRGLTKDHVVFRHPESAVNPVSGDLLGALLDQGPDPDADVGSDDVHQPEAGNALELVDVQLNG